jgi:spore germination cell wall hydrolase CwlJ-like protein
MSSFFDWFKNKDLPKGPELSLADKVKQDFEMIIKDHKDKTGSVNVVDTKPQNAQINVVQTAQPKKLEIANQLKVPVINQPLKMSPAKIPATTNIQSTAPFNKLITTSRQSPVIPAPVVKPVVPAVEKPVEQAPAIVKDDRYNKVLATVLAESLGESDKGKQAVVNTIYNRVGKYGVTGEPMNDAFDVVSEPYQFSAFEVNNPLFVKFRDYLRGKDIVLSDAEKKALDKVTKMVDQAISGQLEDITGGATHYLNPGASRDLSWINSGKAKVTLKEGRHVFATVGKDYQRKIK